jgi:hypothetical protein
MGHADRQRQHYAVRVDPQPRRLCLSTSRSCYSKSNTNANGDVHAHSNTYCNGDIYSNTNPAADTDAKIDANTETSADPAAAPLSVTSKVVSESLKVGGSARALNNLK